MHRRPNTAILHGGRRGSILPILAVALLVIMSGVALVLDRSLIDVAQVELQTAAEAAALAGAGGLVDDDLLRPKADASRRMELAHSAARRIAAENLAGGEPVQLKEGEEGDIKIGRIAVSESTGEVMFLETDRRPQTVVVTARMSRGRGNPLTLLMGKLTGQPGADVSALAEATADNRVIGVRPTEGIPVPAFPLAILANDPTGKRKDTWEQQIVKRGGTDQFGFNESTGEITKGADGIPEIVLCAADRDDKATVPNLRLVDLGNDLRGSRMADQILNGWKLADLRRFKGELLLAEQPLSLATTISLGRDELEAFSQMIGECRICLLYAEETGNDGKPTPDRARCVSLVAGRVLQVIRESGRAPRIVFQPGVVTTRTAVIAERNVSSDSETKKTEQTNEYIYKLSLTR